MTHSSIQNLLEEARNLLWTHQFAEALVRYEALIKRSPGTSVIWYEYGNAASNLRKYDVAERAWQRVLELDAKNAELVSMIGHRYNAMRQPDKAREFFSRAASADPKAINPRISLAVLYEQTHQLDLARAAVEECFKIDSRDDQARYFSAVIDRREGKLDAAENGLRDLIASEPKHPFVRYACRYELAQLLDRAGQFDEAMRLLDEAKAIVRGLTDTTQLLRGYDMSAEKARRFTRGLPKNVLEVWAGYFPERKRDPIPPLAFLGGHPRSGTTLLEQILDAHPQVAALDEPTVFLEVLQPAFFKASDLASARVNALRRSYIDALRQDFGSDVEGRLLLDKNPSPTARLPVWLRVFPELRVLIALRDPRDVVLSCYFQNVPLNADNVNFLSLERVARHYADLMDIWLAVREWPGFTWVETKYEDVVTDMEREGKRITEFLGLKWDPAQSLFYEKSRRKQLYSPTYQDVTRPVYNRSVARWKSYEKYLAPVLSVLEPYCKTFGYE